MHQTAAELDSTGRLHPTIAQLFLAFLKMGLFGFGGVLPWSRRGLVEENKWLTPEEYADLFALCQFLPGGNIMNMAVAVGQRFQGLPGALAAVAGILIAPAVIVIGLGGIYIRYGQTETGHNVLDGITAAAVGLMFSMVLKMSEALVGPGKWAARIFALITFAAVGLLRLPLPLALIVMAPLSIAYVWRRGP
jgi:chromate transporter